MPLLAHSLRSGLRGLVVWSLAIAAIGSFYLSFFAQMSSMMSAKSDLMKSMSPGLMKALGMEDLSNGANYAHATYTGLLGFVLLVVAVTAWATQVTAGPEESGELELTLAHAVGRRRVLIERTLAVIVRVVVLGLVAAATLAAWSQWGGLHLTLAHIPAEVLAWMGLGLLSASAGICAGAFVGRRVVAIAASVAVAVLGYMLNVVGAQSADTKALLDFSPFAWAFRHAPLATGWDWTGLGLLYGTSAILLIIAAVVIGTRDIGR